MITLNEVLQIHEKVISNFGGSFGVRDYNLLEASINRPFSTFDGVDLYPEIEDKSAAIFESIVKNHPFIDGNKRTGYVLMRYLLLKNQKDIKASEADKYSFVIKTAEGRLDFEEIQLWIKDRII
ncbi:type II toxin-antitoxin system death-on-curing family toxin [Weeksellaceae bacterium TAE3-ERU29]|nr:type II toxin-antitoxin system death-on-curing family toxin [Weeksellaceae bacterium TAE3-ERU29]